MWSSRKARGSGPRRDQRAAPDAADLLAAEDDDRAALRPRSTASIAATTPSAPSKRPPRGTVSRCDPVQTLPVDRVDPGMSEEVAVPRRPRPRALPPASHAAASSCASSSAARADAAGSRPARRRSRTARRAARDRASRRSLVSRGSGRSPQPAGEREQRCERERRRPRPRRDARARTGSARGPRARTGSSAGSPIAAPLRAAPASSAAAVNERPFQAIDSPPATASAGTSAPHGPARRTPP